MRIELEQVAFAYKQPQEPKREKRHGKRGLERRSKAFDSESASGGSGNMQDSCPWMLQDANMVVEPGSVLGIAGVSGSGKSTLLQLLAGLLRPVSGRLLVDGVALEERKVQKALRGRVGFLMQYPERQVFAATVLEDVSFGPKNLGFATEQAHARARNALLATGLTPEDFAHGNPFKLSGGQQRRVALAGVLALQPEVLLLDEPTAGMDAVALEDFLKTMKRLHDQGVAIAIASHDMDVLAELCDCVALVSQGRIAASGDKSLLGNDKLMRACGLRITQAAETARGLREGGLALPEGIVARAQLVEALSRML